MKCTARPSGMGAQQKATLLPRRRGRSGGGRGRKRCENLPRAKNARKSHFPSSRVTLDQSVGFSGQEGTERRGRGRGEGGEKTLTRRVDDGEGDSAFRFHRKHPVTMLSRDKRHVPSASAGFRNIASLRQPHTIKNAGEGSFMRFLWGLSRVTEKLRARHSF